MTAPLILASASPRRQDLLRQVGLSFTVMPSDFFEDDGRLGGPEDVVLHNATGKAKEVARRISNGCVLGADTVVACQGQILGKPSDRAEAREMLNMLSGRWHQVFTAVVLVNAADQTCCTDVICTRVHMRDLQAAEIEAYLDTGEPFDKAGAYGIQGMAGMFVDCIDGCYFNVVGLPLSRTVEMLGRIRH